MSKGNNLENDILLKIFQATEFSWNAGGTLYVSLHTDDPGEAGTQSTNEATYGAYQRVGVARTASGWDVATNNAQNHAAVTFPTCTGGSNSITYFGIGTESSGAGILLYSGVLTSPLAVSNNITPSFATGALDIYED